MKKKTEKSLAQIAYEADPRGGIQNFGPWDKLSGPVGELIKDIHQNMAYAIVDEVKARLRKSLNDQPLYLK